MIYIGILLLLLPAVVVRWYFFYEKKHYVSDAVEFSMVVVLLVSAALGLVVTLDSIFERLDNIDKMNEYAEKQKNIYISELLLREGRPDLAADFIVDIKNYNAWIEKSKHDNLGWLRGPKIPDGVMDLDPLTVPGSNHVVEMNQR